MNFLSRLKQSLGACSPLSSWHIAVLYAGLVLGPQAQAYAESPAQARQAVSLAALAQQAQVGDVVYIAVQAYPFQQVGAATLSWVNHVGVVVETGEDPLIAESTFPVSRRTSLSKFVARSGANRVAISRLHQAWTAPQLKRLQHSTARRMGIWYDTGFNLESQRQFCSRYVREVIEEATGITLGEVSTFETLLKHNPEANLKFWQLWYFGRIPWSRQTVTPASIYQDSQMQMVFDGYVLAQ